VNFRGVLAQSDVVDPVQAVLDPPVITDVAGEFGGGDLVERQACEHVDRASMTTTAPVSGS